MKLVLTCESCQQGANKLTKVRLRRMCDDCLRAENASVCACCGADAFASGRSIHRDGFCKGPEVPLCVACGAEEEPSCEEIWERIAARKAEAQP